MITEFRKYGSNDGSSSLAANDWIPYPKVALCPLERTAPTARLGPFVEADAVTSGKRRRPNAVCVATKRRNMPILVIWFAPLDLSASFGDAAEARNAGARPNRSVVRLPAIQTVNACDRHRTTRTTSANATPLITNNARVRHSYRKAVVGSTRAARSAGRRADKEQAKTKHAKGAAMLQMSDGFTSYRRAVMNCEAATPPARPSTRPISVTSPISESTKLTTRSGRAPRATRIPISRVRWTTP